MSQYIYMPVLSKSGQDSLAEKVSWAKTSKEFFLCCGINVTFEIYWPTIPVCLFFNFQKTAVHHLWVILKSRWKQNLIYSIASCIWKGFLYLCFVLPTTNAPHSWIGCGFREIEKRRLPCQWPKFSCETQATAPSTGHSPSSKTEVRTPNSGTLQYAKEYRGPFPRV